MAEIYVYAKDCEDFANFGLVGALIPTSCTFEEEANGMSEITMEHPLDEFGRYTHLIVENLLMVEVPVRTTPEINGGNIVTTVEQWTVRDAATITKAQRSLYKKSSGSRRLKYLNGGTVVTVVNKPAEGRYKVKCEKGTGYMDPAALSFVEARTIADNSQSIESVQPAWTVKPQLFRIYNVEKSIDSIKVSARHISYDLLYNLTSYENTGETTCINALASLMGNCVSTHDFNAYTNIASKRTGLKWEDVNPIDALLNPEEGLTTLYSCSLVRDNWDLYLLDDPGLNRGVTVEYGKNMLGLTCKEDHENIVTRVIPVGETKDGKPLYLSGTKYVDSSRINDYAVPRTQMLKCDNCKVGTDGVTTEIARARMREQAQAVFTNGGDMPELEMSVDFVNLGDTADYAQYRDLERLFLWDYVLIRHKKLDIDVTARIVSIEWDCVSGRMNGMEIGKVGKTLANSGITSWQIPTGFSGSKIANSTVGSAALKSDIIAARHIQTDSINTDALQATCVTAEKIAAGVVSADKLDADTVNARMLDVVSAKIESLTANDIQTDSLAAALAQFTVLTAGTAEFDRATVAHLVAQAMNLEYGVAGQVFIKNLAVEYAQMVGATIGNLCIKASDGNYYSIDVDENGNVSATKTTVTEGEITAGETSGGRVILETNIAAANLNTSNLLATYALINKIDAARIDVAELFAQSAFVDALYTSKIYGDKSIEMIAGQVEQNATDIARNNIHTGTEPPEAPVPDGKLWVDTAQDPNVIRRWLGQNVSTERDYTASASGNPVETPPGTASFDSIQSVLLPVQAGSGDPSPDNIRPITGRTAATLTRCGVNIFPPGEEKTGTTNGITFVSDGNGKYTLNGTSTGSAAFVINLVKPVRIPDAYVGYFHMLNSVANGYFAFGFIENGTQTSFSAATIINRIRSIDEFGSLLRGRTIDAVQLFVSGSGRVFDNFSLAPMLLQTGTLTDYMPYTGGTYTADFGQTVYGGTMDWLTGVLTVDSRLMSLDGTENWVYHTSGFLYMNFSVYARSDKDRVIASHYPQNDFNTGANGVAIVSTGTYYNQIRFYGTGYTDVNVWKSYLAAQYTAGTPVQVAYKLATPITIQLPPATVTALKGVNTLHTDADSVSVVYTASGWEIVNDLSEINDVSNRLLAQQAAAQQAIDQLATAITVDSDGAHFYKPGYRAQNEVRIDQDSVDILVGGSVNSSFVAGGLILGNYMLWHPEAAGGLAFNLV